jgi:hypothetical protein
MERLKKGLTISVIGAVLIVLIGYFVAPQLALNFKEKWKPKFESVERETFEQSKSYTEGRKMDLAKYYREYKSTTNPEEKIAIENLVLMDFSDFDATTINSIELRSFLYQMRGY